MSEKLEHLKQTLVPALAATTVLGLFGVFVYLGMSAWFAAALVLLVVPAYGAWRLNQAREVSSWDKVSAVVDAAWISSRPVPGEHFSVREHFPLVRVRHMAEGKEFVTECFSRFRYDYGSRKPEEANSLLDQFQAGSTVTIFRNPKDLGEVSVVEHVSKRMKNHYLAITIGGSLAVGVLAWLWCAIAL